MTKFLLLTSYAGGAGSSQPMTDWDPEDTAAWEAGNNKIARRNLIWSVAAEHVGFSIWSIWSVMVLFMPASVYGFSAGDKFLLAATATLVGFSCASPWEANPATHASSRASAADRVNSENTFMAALR